MIVRGRRWEKTSLGSYLCVLHPTSQLMPWLHFTTLPVLRGKEDFRSMEAQTISQQRLTRIFRVAHLFTGNPKGSKRAVLLLNTAHLSLWVKPQESRVGPPHRKCALQCDLSTTCQDHNGVLTPLLGACCGLHLLSTQGRNALGNLQICPNPDSWRFSLSKLTALADALALTFHLSLGMCLSADAFPRRVSASLVQTLPNHPQRCNNP